MTHVSKSQILTPGAVVRPKKAPPPTSSFSPQAAQEGGRQCLRDYQTNQVIPKSNFQQ